MRNIGILDEATLNAVKAALDERVVRLEATVELWQRAIDKPRLDELPTEDAQRAYVWSVAALHETKMAQEVFAEVRDTPEPESELRYAWGDR